MKKILHAKALVVKENIVEQTGVIDAVVGSTNVLDRMGDIIDQNGWDLKDFKRNPVILWGHNVREEKPPIGKALKVWIENKGKNTAKLMFKVQFDLLDSFAAEIFRKIKDGFLNTVSVGFLPEEWEELDPDNWFGGLKYKKQQLLELSFVPVPANPEALVGLRSFAEKDKRFTPTDDKTLYPTPTKEVLAGMLHKELKEKEIKKEEVVKPYENEHACRIKNPDDFEDNSFRSTTRDHEGKEYRVIMGKLKGKDTMTDQSYRYNKDTWDESAASAHCKDHDGTFEPAKKEEPSVPTKAEKDGTALLQQMEEHIASMAELHTKMENDMGEDDGKAVSDTDVKAMQGHAQSVDGLCTDMTDMMGGKSASEPTPSTSSVIDPPAPPAPEASKSVIPYKDMGTLPESEGWDGPGETSKATVEDLKLMCTWFDSEKAEDKSSYKLPHHKAEGHKAVWRGVAAAMASLLGARGGVGIPEEDRKGVYNHLVKHYKQFDKEAPDYKMVENRILGVLEEELQALVLDREDKHVVRLVRKVLENTKEQKTSDGIIIEALKTLNLALTQVKSTTKGGE